MGVDYILSMLAKECPVCGFEESMVMMVQEDLLYYLCPSCICLFTPCIPDNVLVTENDNPEDRNTDDKMFIRSSTLIEWNHFPNPVFYDFGCGNGEFSEFLRSRLDDLYGPGECSVLRYDKDYANPPEKYSDGSIHGIIMIEVIEHISEPTKLFAQFNRILAPDGFIYIESSYLNNMTKWNDHPYIDPKIGHCTIHSIQSMTKLASMFNMRYSKINSNIFIFRKIK